MRNNFPQPANLPPTARENESNPVHVLPQKKVVVGSASRITQRDPDKFVDNPLRPSFPSRRADVERQVVGRSLPPGAGGQQLPLPATTSNHHALPLTPRRRAQARAHVHVTGSDSGPRHRPRVSRARQLGISHVGMGPAMDAAEFCFVSAALRFDQLQQALAGLPSKLRLTADGRCAGWSWFTAY